MRKKEKNLTPSTHKLGAYKALDFVFGWFRPVMWIVIAVIMWTSIIHQRQCKSAGGVYLLLEGVCVDTKQIELMK